MNKKNVYFVGIGGIWVSALARYYLSEWYQVFGSDSTDSKLIADLQAEGCDIIIGADAERISSNIEKIIYSEAVPLSQVELKKALELWVDVLKYNQALWEVVNAYKLIAVTGTHGKSTTSSMISQILKHSHENFVSIVGTLLKEFDGKNFYSSKPHPNPLLNKERETHEMSGRGYFVIEACEHKEHFLAYTPTLGVITNIEYDHADYYKTPADYIYAFEKFVGNILPWGFCILNGEDSNCRKMLDVRSDIHFILVYQDSFTTLFPWEKQESNRETFPEIVLHIPGEHILFDAKIAYIISHMIGIPEITTLESLEAYSGVWRRMEKIWITQNRNLLMSDYGHHPTEIRTTLKALKSGYPEKKLYVIFQPHQYSRTIELLDGFKESFSDADFIIVPDIYESRDSEENKSKMNSQKFVGSIHHAHITNGQSMEKTLRYIEEYDQKNPESSIILLLWAGNVDNLRYKIKTR